jgi:hypothetical protein
MMAGISEGMMILEGEFVSQNGSGSADSQSTRRGMQDRALRSISDGKGFVW